MSNLNDADTNNMSSNDSARLITFGNKLIKFGDKLTRIGSIHVDDYTQTGDVVVINDAASFTQSGTEVTIH